METHYGPIFSTKSPVIWSWPHHKKRINTILSDFHDVHMDVDRIFFGLDEIPLEEEEEKPVEDKNRARDGNAEGR